MLRPMPSSTRAVMTAVLSPKQALSPSATLVSPPPCQIRADPRPPGRHVTRVDAHHDFTESYRIQPLAGRLDRQFAHPRILYRG